MFDAISYINWICRLETTMSGYSSHSHSPPPDADKTHDMRCENSGKRSQAITASQIQSPVAPSSSLNSSNNELLSTYECPVCTDYMLPPYLQCQSGHLVCGNCRPKVTCCPTCRGPVPSIRNLAMERIAQTLMFPCKYVQSGCKLTFGAQEKVEHEEHCEHRFV